MIYRRLCALADIPEGGSRGFVVEGERVFAVRHGDSVHVYANRCPHIGIPLEWVPDQFLDASNSMIQCANHGALFVITSGKCVAGPCAGKKLQSIPHQLQHGDIVVAVEKIPN